MTKQKFKFVTTVTKEIEIEIDLDKITPEAIAEYHEMITYIGDDPIDHLKNIASHAARENWWNCDKFLEGYGDLGEEFDALIVNESFDEVEVDLI
ncbi:hypothetical protein PP939_gp164 [Rhizobium phage RL38J1]|uniref:Uncharacterized protein n=1 Tax=Rhizobium phage RL38J1 TaxID=2663232 RepID=A0A6B9J1C4_9CAUD|nr:hypothetical protein PP939_gp164 [Rhizobium phage RL38J1]QGZ13997.1 hypothetical protein RL38J1_164 [Rhizobium phage RL38J1]